MNISDFEIIDNDNNKNIEGYWKPDVTNARFGGGDTGNYIHSHLRVTIDGDLYKSY